MSFVPFLNMIKHRNPGETEFHQAVQEVVETLMPFVMVAVETLDEIGDGIDLGRIR